MSEHHGSLLEWLYSFGILPEWVPRAAPHSFVVIVLLVTLSILATRNMRKVPRGIQNFMEWCVEELENFTVSSIGPEGRKFTPFVGAFFLYILSMNLLGLIPGMMAPTSALNTTVALGLSAIFAVHYYAIRANGVKAWASHFVGDPWWLGPLMVPLHIVGEVARPLSLSLRLFGNIFGEEMVIAILAGFSPVILRIAGIDLFAVPVQLPMLLFAIFTSFLQALVFSMLVSIYISVTVGDHAHHDESHGTSHEEPLGASRAHGENPSSEPDARKGVMPA